METIVLAVPASYGSEIPNVLERSFEVVEGADGALVVCEGGSRVYVRRVAAEVSDLEQTQLSAVRLRVASPAYYLLDYSEISLCKKVVEALADRGDVFVDNDFGVFVTGAEFVAMMRVRPLWDWRRDE